METIARYFSVLATVCGGPLFCFSMTMTRSIKKWFSTSVWKNLFGLHRALTLTLVNTFGINWNITQHLWFSSLMLLWLKGNKSLQPGCGKPSYKGGSCSCSIAMSVVLGITYGCPHAFFGCSRTFGNHVYLQYSVRNVVS